MEKPGMFRQTPGVVRRGITERAENPDPSPQVAGIERPVWRSFVGNEAFQKVNAPLVKDEQRRMAEAARPDPRPRGAAVPRAPKWKAGIGSLQVEHPDGQVEDLDPESLLDDPEVGNLAAESLWKRDMKAAADERDSIRFRLQDPSDTRRLTAKEREDALLTGGSLAETDPQHVALKKRLMDDEARTADEQAAYDADARVRKLTAGGVAAWRAGREASKGVAERAGSIAAKELEIDAAEESAVAEDRALDEKMRRGVSGAEVGAIQARKAEIATARQGMEAARGAVGVERGAVSAAARREADAMDGKPSVPASEKMAGALQAARLFGSATSAMTGAPNKRISRRVDGDWDLPQMVRSSGGWTDGMKGALAIVDQKTGMRLGDGSSKIDETKAIQKVFHDFQQAEGLSDEEMASAWNDLGIFSRKFEDGEKARVTSQGQLVPNPGDSDWLDTAKARGIIESSAASPESKAATLTNLPAIQEQIAKSKAAAYDEASRSGVFGAPGLNFEQIPLFADFAKQRGGTPVEQVRAYEDQYLNRRLGVQKQLSEWMAAGQAGTRKADQMIFGLTAMAADFATKDERLARDEAVFNGGKVESSMGLKAADFLRGQASGLADSSSKLKQGAEVDGLISSLIEEVPSLAIQIGLTRFAGAAGAAVSGSAGVGRATGLLASFTAAGGQSAGVTYAQQIAAGDTPEEANAKALKAGLNTAIITGAFSAIGLGGMENIAAGGAARMTLGNFLAFSKKKGIANVATSKEFRQFVGSVLKSAGGEASEEGIDELTSVFLTADPDENLADAWSNAVEAAKVGGFIGGAVDLAAGAKADGEWAARTVQSTPEDRAARVNAEIAAVNPTAAPAAPEEVAAAEDVVGPFGAGPDAQALEAEIAAASPEEAAALRDKRGRTAAEEVAAGVEIVREIAAEEAEVEEVVAEAEAGLAEAMATGDPVALEQATAGVAVARAGRSKPARARGVLKIARGETLETLTAAELRSLGVTREGKPMKEEELAAVGLATPAVEVLADGSLIVLDGALAELSPAARKRVKMGEAEARRKAVERVESAKADAESAKAGAEGAKVEGQSTRFTVTGRAGTVVEVEAADEQAAQIAGAEALPMGETVASVSVTPTGSPGKTITTPSETVTGAGSSPETVTKVRPAVVKKIAKLKKSLGANLTVTDDPAARAVATDAGIVINPSRLVDEAAANGLDAAQADAWVQGVIDEELRHFAHLQASQALWKSSGTKQDLESWRADYYGAMWREEFAGERGATVAKLYGASFDALPDEDKAMEGLRMMSQKLATGNPTEVAKLWTNAGPRIIKAIRAALKALKAMVSELSPALKAEIAAIEAQLSKYEQNTGTVPDRGTKPAEVREAGGDVPGGGKGSDNQAAGAREADAGAGGEVLPAGAGRRVSFTRGGERRSGVVVAVATNGTLLVNLDGGGRLTVSPDEVEAGPAPLMPSEEDTVTPGNKVTRQDGMRGEVVSESDGNLQVEWFDGSVSAVREDQLKSRSTKTSRVVRNTTSIEQSSSGGSESFTVMQADENGKLVAVQTFKGETDEEVQRAYSRARELAESRARSKNHGVVVDRTISGGGKQIPVTPSSSAAPATLDSPADATPKGSEPAAGDSLLDGWEAFGPQSGTIGIPRAEMPQIDSGDRSAALQFLRARGMDYREETVTAESILPTQAEFSRKKVQAAKNREGGERALLVAEDSHLIDGHHQWLTHGRRDKVRIIRVLAPIREVLSAVKEMPSADVAPAFSVGDEVTWNADSGQVFGQIYEIIPGGTLKVRTLDGNSHLRQPAQVRATVKEMPSAEVAPAPKPKAAKKPKEPAPTPKPEKKWTTVGTNADGDTIEQDAQGVRSYVQNGFRITQSVGVVPGRGLAIDGPETLYKNGQSRFLTVDEVAKFAPAKLDIEQLSEDRAKILDTLQIIPSVINAIRNTPQNAQYTVAEELRQLIVNMLNAETLSPASYDYFASNVGKDQWIKGVVFDIEKMLAPAAPAPPSAPPLSAGDSQILGALDGLFAAPLSENYDKDIPSDRFMALMGAANTLVGEGVTTPEALAAKFSTLAEGRLKPFTQKVWFALKSAGAKGAAEPDWAAIYDGIDNTPRTNDDATDDTKDSPGSSGDSSQSGESLVGGTEESAVDTQPSGEGTGAGTSEQLPGNGSGSRKGGNSGTVGGNASRPGSRPEAGAPGSRNEPVGSGERGAEGTDSVGTGDGSGVAGGTQPADRDGYRLTDPERIIGTGGPKARFARNRLALETYDNVLSENRPPTKEEQDILAAYIGWGSFGQELFQGSWDRPNPKPEFKTESEWLRDHLGKEGWESIRDSIINAHYTDPPHVEALWRIVGHLGFKGGRVLEPSMGIGTFFGLMPDVLRAKSSLTGIELDRVVGGMAQMLYPDANIRIMGYEKSATADGFYDLVIGNWPFAKDGPSDARYNSLGLSLHDYFFVKALDQTRPGGLVIGITSSGTMDKKGQTARRQMARRAELVAAFRFPSGAFEKYAGTKVVTDVVILKRREQDSAGVDSDGWINTEEFGTGNEKFTANEYWRKNPGNVLGEMTFGSGTTQGRAGMIVNRQPDYQEVLATIEQRLPKDILTDAPARKTTAAFQNRQTTADQNSIVWNDGDATTPAGFYVVRGEQIEPIESIFKWELADSKKTDKRRDELKQLLGIRESVQKLLAAQRDGDPDTESVRKEARTRYETFAADHGPIAKSFMVKVLTKAADPMALTLENLERKEGRKYVPREILLKDIMRRPVTDAKGSIEDAFAIQRNQSTELDVDAIAEISGKPVAAVVDRLLELDQIYKTPAGKWESREEYLGGNVRRKLLEAKDAKAQGIDMDRNIEALEKIQPKDVAYFEIEVQMGASWIPREVYEEFAADLLGGAKGDVQLTKAAGGWNFKLLNERLLYSTNATSTWGTSRIRFNKVFQAAMNGTTVKIYDTDSDGVKTLNNGETELANKKIDDIREELSRWLWSDPERTGKLSADYNEVMNSEVVPQRSGSHLRFEGLALTLGNSEFDFRQHQKDAVWRFIMDGRGVGAHEVGTGKTFTMAGLAVEGRRLGRFRKSLVFAHNANAESVFRDFQAAYPGGKFLFIDNLSPANRDNAMRQIATDEWDAVVVPHSLIDRFALREETLMQIAAKEIQQMESEIADALDELGVGDVDINDEEDVRKKLGRTKDSHTAKELVKARNRIIKRIRDKAAKGHKDNAVFFEDLGVDSIMVDEAHMFKKIALATRKEVKGLNKTESERGWMLGALTDTIKARNNGKGVFLFTGTPLTNNLNEAYNMMRFVMDDTMSDAGIDGFDDWFNSFAASVTDVELTTGGTFEPVTRLLSFINVPELARLAGRFFDVVLAKNMPEFVARDSEDGKSPNAIGRPFKKVRPITSEMSAAQRAHKVTIQERYRAFQALTGKDKRRAMLDGVNTPIQLETEGIKAALDLRMVFHGAADNPDSKINSMLRNAIDHYTEDETSTQMIFMEQGWNDYTDAQVAVKDGEGRTMRDSEGKKITTKERRRQFNLVRDMVEKLVAKGVRPEEIAIFSNMSLDPMDQRPGDVLRQVKRVSGKITKEDLAAEMRVGKIRFAIGSTQTMGTGVNAQTKLRAMHHLDAPWTPGEFEQRNGRGHRQGNEWNTVFEYRYFTEGSHDGRRWQVLLNKVKFISRFTEMLISAGGSDLRVLTGDGADLGEEGSNVSDFEQSFSTAAGDPRVLVRAKLRTDVEKLERKRDAHLRSISRAQTDIVALKRRKVAEANTIAESEELIESIAEIRERPFTVKIEGKTYAERKDAEEVIAAYPSLTQRDDGKEVMTVQGVPVFHEWYQGSFGAGESRFYAQVPIKSGKSVRVNMGKLSLSSLESNLRGQSRLLATQKENFDTIDASVASLEEMIQKPFTRQPELDAKTAALQQIEVELNRAPQPAPAWLRNGAPVGSLVYLEDGKAYDVAAHRWDENGYWILIEDASGMRPVNYRKALDDSKQPMFEEVEFVPPETRRDDEEQAPDGPGLQAAPLSDSETPDNIRRLTAAGRKTMADAETEAEARKQQAEFADQGKVIGTPRLANMSDDEVVRAAMDRVDEMRKFTVIREKKAAWERKGRSLADGDESGEVENWLANAFSDEGQAIKPENVVAMRIIMERRVKAAGNDLDKHADNAVLMHGYREARANQARVLAAGTDPFKNPEERYRDYLAGVIYELPPRVIAAIEDRSRTPAAAREAIRKAVRARLETVEKALKKLGVTLDEITGGQVFLSLSQTAVMKDTLSRLTPAEKTAVKAIQSGGTVADVRRKSGLSDERIQALAAQVRRELADKLRAKVAAGLKLEDLKDEMKGLRAAALSAADIEAELERILTVGFGIPETVPTARLPKSRSRVEADDENDPNAASKRVVKRWIERLAVSQSDTLAWAEKNETAMNEMEALIRAHIKQPVPGFIDKAISLGATEDQARVINAEANEERKRVSAIRGERERKAEAERKAPGAIAKRWIDRLATSQSDTLAWKTPAKTSALEALIREHLKKPVPDFIAKATALGATANQARLLDREAATERHRVEMIRQWRKDNPKARKVKTTVVSADWNRPEFADELASYAFDTKDRSAIMTNVIALRDLVAAGGKIERLSGEKKQKAIAIVAEMNKLLAKDGVTVADVLKRASNKDDYRFDITDRVHVMILARTIRALDADIVDKGTEFYYSSILSGLQTMMVNATGALNSVWQATVDRGVEAAINVALKDPQMASFAEVKYMLKAMGPMLSRAWSNAQSTWAAETPFFDEDVLGRTPDLVRMQEGTTGYKTGSISGTKGRIIRIPGRILMATDDFMNTARAVAEVGAMAYRFAIAQGLKPGTPEFDKLMKQQVNIPGSEAWQMAGQRALVGTFNNALPGQRDAQGQVTKIRTLTDLAGGAIYGLTHSKWLQVEQTDGITVKLLKTIPKILFFPFVRVPFNILKQGIERSVNPISIFGELVPLFAHNIRIRDGRLTMNADGDKARIMELVAKQVQGAFLMILLAALGEGDDDDLEKTLIVTGSRPFGDTKKGERELGYRLGLGPYEISMKLPGGKRVGFSYGRLEPAATVLGGTVDTLKNLKAAARGRVGTGDALGKILSSFVAQGLDKTSLRGAADLQGILAGEKPLDRFTADRIGAIMPNILKQAVRESDPVFREKPDDFMEMLARAVWPRGGPAAMDVYGEAQDKKGTSVSRTLDFTDFGGDEAQPYDAMLWRYKQKNPDPKTYYAPQSASTSYTIGGVDKKMNAAQAARFKEAAGKRTLVRLKATPLNLTDPQAADIKRFKDAVDAGRDDARKILFNSPAWQNLK